MHAPPLKGVLWDVDGTIAETEREGDGRITLDDLARLREGSRG
jgi:hypothetical protein